MVSPKMAAPMKTCLLNLRKCCFSWTATRYYSRRMKRSVQEVMSPEEDVQKLKNTVADPRKNPYLPFDPRDPVQKSLIFAATRSKENVSSYRNKENVSDNRNKDNKKREPQHVSDRSNSKSLSSSPKPSKVRKNEKFQNTVNFEKLEETDRRFGRHIMRARAAKDREEHREIVLEGKNLIHDALLAGAKLKVLYFTRLETVEELPAESLEGAQIYKVQYKHLKLWSDVETPQGLLGIFEMPPVNEALRPAANPIPLTVICDSVRDGGNLGTLIRTAAAVGCHRIIAMKGCVDIWNGKVLRSAAGSHYRVPILSNITWPQVPALLPPGDSIKVFLADSKQVTEEERESGPLEAETLAAVEQIEKFHDKESDIEDETSDIENSAEFDEDNDAGNEVISEQEINEMLTKEVEKDLSYKNFKVLSAYRKAPLGNDLYDMVDYTDKHAVLVISGETSGVSLPARKLAYDHYGGCVTIPMTGEVESLNCAVAGSIIMYEVAKQYRNSRIQTDKEEE
ncbi:rRNA methyltransferase 3, mitochondrial-like isoform X1 [Mercenaria mercenaria]|uniref:rRNA methyltransferase 3, mitochondrial-like isoform X1 n=2 Tax=Mercenaria mercenaria TaxID=6596 RepID=UPI00234F983E|nr:rRNA methyltransferase 3, mitochondrial-like isoform X1 [Mercenaria mercenaria]